MLDVVLVALFVILPIATFMVTRSLTWTAVGLAFGFGVAGNAVQTLISFGMEWTTRGLQGLAVVVMLGVLAFGLVRGRGRGSVKHQVLVIVLPAVVIGGSLILLRLMAPGSPGPLTAVGYLFNHPQAEDNAKWLHLTSQLADGRVIEFSGYAGGPLLLLMSVMAALISALSLLLLGGVNEVAVAANTLVGTQFLLIALVPFALSPFAERRVRAGRDIRALAPWPTVVVAMITLVIASSVITSFGHLSLQFVLVILVLWSSVFLLRVPGRSRLLATWAVVCSASVWIPLNVLGIALLIVTLVWVVRRRDWWSLGLWALTVAATWDALVSSTLFLLGITPDAGSSGAAGDGLTEVGASTPTSSLQTLVADQVQTAKSLFTAPGGVEQIQPLVAGLALACVLFAGWLMARPPSRPRAAWMRFGPIVALSGYLLIITVADAIATGGAPHYGGHKMAFAVIITGLVSTLPIAVMGIDRGIASMTPARWLAVGGVLVVLTLDTMLPRALSALSPVLWPAVDASSPAYWAPAEVKPTGDQPVASLPVACMFAPPESEVPTALPLGQEAYTCTRLLLGLNGLEGEATALTRWLQTDWLSQQSQWDVMYERLVEASGDLKDRSVILMNPEGGTAGLASWGTLLERYRVVTP